MSKTQKLYFEGAENIHLLRLASGTSRDLGARSIALAGFR